MSSPLLPSSALSLGRRLLAVSATLTLAAGCGNGAAQEQPAPEVTTAPAAAVTTTLAPGTAYDGSWRLAELVIDGQPVELPQADPITLDIDQTTASGRASCLTYRLVVGIDGGQFRSAGSTRSSGAECSAEFGSLDENYLSALDAGEQIRTEADQLVIGGPTSTLTFASAEAIQTDSLIGTTWRIQQIYDPEASAPAAPDSEATLTLDSSGTIEVATGCQTLIGNFTVRGSELLVDIPPTETASCPTDELAAQDDRLGELLRGRGLTPAIDGDQLRLDARGGLGLAASSGSESA